MTHPMFKFKLYKYLSIAPPFRAGLKKSPKIEQGVYALILISDLATKKRTHIEVMLLV